MSSNSCTRKGSNILWSGLAAATFLFCSLLIYQSFIHKDDTCSSVSECSTSSKYVAEKLQKEECRSVCNTKECIEISNDILNKLDQTADPCDDFYNFACGKFKEKYEATGNCSTIDFLTDDLLETIRDVIETSKEPYGSAFHKVKVVYDSCMNPGSSELRDTEKLLDFIRNIGIPNWPHLSSNFSFKNPTLPDVLGKLHSYQEDVFFRFSASDFDKILAEDNGALRNLTVRPALPSYRGEFEEKQLEKAVTGILLHIGLDLKAINKTWKEFNAVNSQVFMLLIETVDGTGVCEDEEVTHHESYNCLETNANRNFLCKVLYSVVRNARIASRYNKLNVDVACDVKPYIEKMGTVVSNCSDREIANYIALRVFINNMKHMHFSIRKKLNVFMKPILIENQGEYATELDKWKYCVSWIAKNMQLPLGAMYVDKMWPKEAEDKVNDIFKEFVNAINDFLLQQQWIEGPTKEVIVKEVKEIESTLHKIIGLMRNKTKINLLYKRFNPSRSSFIRNVLIQNRNYFYISTINEEDVRHFADYNTFVVNAYGGDTVYLTFGILLPPIFKYGYPNLFNIAKIGQIVGHEIGHKLYYFFELSTNVDNQTLSNFKERKDCLIDQYFNFELKRIQKFVEGNMTVSENFPDNMSLKVVEKVSEKYFDNMTRSGFALPGLSYSPEELVYISYAQTWCTVRSIEKQRYYYDRDPHSPPEFRIIGAFQNSRKFSEVFNCADTSYMNLKKKCSIFD